MRFVTTKVSDARTRMILVVPCKESKKYEFLKIILYNSRYRIRERITVQVWKRNRTTRDFLLVHDLDTTQNLVKACTMYVRSHKLLCLFSLQLQLWFLCALVLCFECCICNRFYTQYFQTYFM